MPRCSRASISGMAGDCFELVGVDRLMSGREQAIYLAHMRADAMRTPFARPWPHRGSPCERRAAQVYVLHLDCAAASQFVIQMLPCAAEWLPRAL